MIGNSGNFTTTLPLIWKDKHSPFDSFLELCDWLHEKLGRRHGIALVELGEQLFNFLRDKRNLSVEAIAMSLWHDYQAGGRSDQPLFLRPFLYDAPMPRRDRSRSIAPKRQERHLAQLAVPAPKS